MKTALFEEINNFTPRKRKNHAYKYDKPKERSRFDASSSLYQWHNVIFLGALILVYLVFISKAVNVQLSHKEKYLGLAESNRMREFSILPSRGVIYDRNGEVVVRNKPSFSLEINTLFCREGTNMEPCLAVVRKVEEYVVLEELPRIEEEIETYKTNVLLATGLTKDEILPLEANISQLTGVSIETAPSRDYLFSDAFAHVIGYVGLGESQTPSIVGKSGVEEKYDSYLSGVAGNKVVQVDSPGTSYKLISSKSPLPGKDITLFVDAGLQEKAFEVLKAKVEDPESEATGGAIVVQDPLDGSVLALVSYPSFDPNLLSSGISQDQLDELNGNPNHPFFNRVIAGKYPPGSTFKLVTASAALMDKVIGIYDTIIDKGFIQIGGSIFRNWRSGEGAVNLIRALQVSNDTYFYTMGGGYGGVGGLGIKRLHDWALKLGFGQLTGIDINGEIPGFIPDGTHRDWYQGDDFNSAIGQGEIEVTTMQINNMMSYFANGGYIYKPRIVKSIDGVGETQGEVQTAGIIDEEYYDAIRKGINLAVKPGGTAYPLFGFPAKFGLEAAGKTGTSEYINAQGEDKTHAIFTAFAPYYDDENRQRNMNFAMDKPIVLTVFIEGGGGGSDDAAPLANELLEYWFAR